MRQRFSGSAMQRYDLIGDIHGQAGKLTALLAKLGYEREGGRGAYRHAERTAIFLGDFIDRGPAIRETLHLVRGMVEAGAALAVVGNHEFNALAWHFGHRELLSERMQKRLSRTHEAFADHVGEWDGFLRWFAGLPLFLDLGKLRVVHAVWSDAALDAIGHHRTLDEVFFGRIASAEAVCRAVSVLLNGWKVEPPMDAEGEDAGAAEKHTIRLAWWRDRAPFTWRNSCMPNLDALPETELPDDLRAKLPGYAEDAPPVIFGHYCLPLGEGPRLFTPNVACVDYCAAQEGPLVGYRWEGEGRLLTERFVW